MPGAQPMTAAVSSTPRPDEVVQMDGELLTLGEPVDRSLEIGVGSRVGGRGGVGQVGAVVDEAKPPIRARRADRAWSATIASSHVVDVPRSGSN